MGKSKHRLAIIITILSALLIGVIGAGLIGTFLTPGERVAADPGEILDRIRDLQQLKTSEFVYREVVFHEVEQRILGIRTGNQSVLFAVNVQVDAGVNLDRGVQVQAVDEATVLITLPAAEILRIDVDESSIHQYFAEERFGRLDMNRIGRQIETTKATIRQDAIERGILQRAERQAEQTVRSMFSAAGWQRIDTRFRPAEELQG